MSDQPAPAFDPPGTVHQPIPDMPDPDPMPMEPEPAPEPEGTPQPEEQPHPTEGDAKRLNLMALGEVKVRHLLSQQLMVHHMIQPAHAWLDELDAKRKEEADAIDQGQQPSGDFLEHRGDDQERPSARTGEGSSLPLGGQGSVANGDATERSDTADAAAD